jgi:hypothetical protein
MTSSAIARYAVMATFVLGLGLLAGTATAANIPINNFTFSQTDPLPYQPLLPLRAGGLALADFTGDGNVDAAVAGTYVAGAALIINKGNGVPAVASWINTGAWSTAVLALDVSGDGKMDLVVCEQNAGGVAVYTNDGTGAMTRSAFYATGVRPMAVVAADIDYDYRLDLVVANCGGSVTVLHNTGGGFMVWQTIDVAGGPDALAVADLDHDAYQDVAVACAMDDTVKVLKNTFGVLSEGGTFNAGPYPVSVAAGDLNNDGNIDLAATDREAMQVTVLLNDGAGQFTSKDVPLRPASDTPFDPPVDLQLADQTGDGKLDIYCANVILTNDGAANFTTPASYAGYNMGTVYAQAVVPPQKYLFRGMSHSSSLMGMNVVSASYYPPPGPAIPPGDINRDGVVDVADLMLLVDAFGANVGEGRFRVVCDLNRDGSVDVVDLLMFVEYMRA